MNPNPDRHGLPSVWHENLHGQIGVLDGLCAHKILYKGSHVDKMALLIVTLCTY